MFLVNVGEVELRPRAGLLWRGDAPVGVRAPEADLGRHQAFRSLNTAHAVEALTLTADGVLDQARPWLRSDGTAAAVELSRRMTRGMEPSAALAAMFAEDEARGIEPSDAVEGDRARSGAGRPSAVPRPAGLDRGEHTGPRRHGAVEHVAEEVELLEE